MTDTQIDEQWGGLCVPPGWEPVAAMCREARADLPARVRATVDKVREEVPEYRDVAVPPEDLSSSVAQHFDALLRGIAERRAPTEEEIQRLSQLGSRRAHQDFPLDCLLQAYHVGYRDLWRRLLRDASDREVAHLLLQAATTMWDWTYRVTDGIGRAHTETMHRLEVRAESNRHRFVELVVAGDHDSDELLTLCRSLGFDPRGTFRAWVVPIVEPDADGSTVARLRAGLAHAPGIHQAVSHGPRLVVVSQDEDPVQLEALLAELLTDATIGVGMVRPGLRGARLSIGDAALAADTTTTEGVRGFVDVWAWAVLGREAERLDAVLRRGREVADDHPSLARTVESFAANGFSVSAAARPLHVHANTVAYRLERWNQLTGWDPRTFDGLVRSVASLRVPLADEPPTDEHPQS